MELRTSGGGGGGRVDPMRTDADREGGQNGRFFADVLYGQPYHVQ